MRGQIIKGVGGKYLTICDGEIFSLSPRKKTKESGNFFIGDYVDFDPKTYSIEKIHPRKNSLSRPPIANIDKTLIMVSTLPIPDFGLIDKILVDCEIMSIEPYLAVNKIDLKIDSFIENVMFQYGGAVKEIFTMSTFDRSTLTKVEKVFSSGITCLVGQSAVGKTSLINAITQGFDNEVGILSKIGRGKHTTRHSEIIKSDFGGFLIDTPGFSFLDIDIDERELIYYFRDFFAHQSFCKFATCTHTKEPGCKIKELVESGKLSSERYERYLKFYQELFEKRKKKY